MGAGIVEILKSIKVELTMPLIVKTDNTAAQMLAQEGCSWRTRHFAVKAAGIREQVQLGSVELQHVPGREQ
eukprot:6474035-Amphidinium_carterae.1